VTISSNVSSALSTLIAEAGPEYFTTAMANASPLLKSGLLPQEDTEGEEYVVTLYPTSDSSTAFVLDGGVTPNGVADLPLKARALPAIIYSQITMGRVAMKAKLSDGAHTRQLDAQMKKKSADVARQLNAALHGASIAPQNTATWTGTASGSTVTIPLADVRLLRVGQAVDFLDASASKAYVIRVQSITPAARTNTVNVAGDVAFINDVPNPATGSVVALTDTSVTTSDFISLRGTTVGFGGSNADQGALINSFDKISGASPAAAFMGVDPAVNGLGYGWVGNYINIGAAFSQESVLAFAARVATVGGESPECAVMHPQTAASHRASGDIHGAGFGLATGVSAGRPMPLDKSGDKFGRAWEDDGLRLSGATVLQDPNMMIGRVTLFDGDTTKIAKWSDIMADEQSGDCPASTISPDQRHLFFPIG
jgi:hypothetical protein